MRTGGSPGRAAFPSDGDGIGMVLATESCRPYASTAFQPPSVRVFASKLAPILTSFLGLPSAPVTAS